mmetsp:Transcript_22175/g.31688  ORF Transcript_22175/g.31688 Transcript_22175/m.31688 type:complete len:86 (+) Transcript_22175:53-310(+)
MKIGTATQFQLIRKRKRGGWRPAWHFPKTWKCTYSRNSRINACQHGFDQVDCVKRYIHTKSQDNNALKKKDMVPWSANKVKRRTR